MNKILIILLFFANFLNVYCDRKGYYTVIGSNVIKNHKPYRVSVTYQGYEQETILQIGIEKLNRYDEHKVTQNVTLNGSGVKEIEFNINNQSAGYYKMTVKTNTGRLPSFGIINSIMKTCSILIQTDKSIYKPSDTVKFRVIVIDEDTKPCNFESVDIFITDGADNRVKQYQNLRNKFTSGVYQNEFLLSDSPVLGQWKINTKVDDEELTIKTFDVDEYVLPTFELILDVNPVANLKDDMIYAGIDAKYTFGKVAKGNATVTAMLYSNYGSARHNKSFKHKVMKSIKIDGKKFIEFSLKDDFGVDSNAFLSRSFNCLLNVTFVDELSGITATAKTDVTVHKTPYNLKVQVDRKLFKPNELISATVHVNLHDRNIPVTDKYSPVVLKVIYYYNMLQESHPENGTWEFTPSNYMFHSKIMVGYLLNGRTQFDVKTYENLLYIRLEAQYLDNEDKTLSFISPVEFEETDDDMQVSLMTERPTLNKTISIKVTSKHNMDQLTYQVIARANLIQTKTIKFKTTKDIILDFMPQKSMAPTSLIIIYFVSENGKHISNTLEVPFDRELPNFVSLYMNVYSEQELFSTQDALPYTCW
ncbi:CD109 antigen-like [Chironomus tepperi]|uniref:CD109 antigen-like n=1 Tax=Chironomus tepperi TaxID=113505 RepID=UPI00391F498F